MRKPPSTSFKPGRRPWRRVGSCRPARRPATAFVGEGDRPRLPARRSVVADAIVRRKATRRGMRVVRAGSRHFKWDGLKRDGAQSAGDHRWRLPASPRAASVPSVPRWDLSSTSAALAAASEFSTPGGIRSARIRHGARTQPARSATPNSSATLGLRTSRGRSRTPRRHRRKSWAPATSRSRARRSQSSPALMRRGRIRLGERDRSLPARDRRGSRVCCDAQAVVRCALARRRR